MTEHLRNNALLGYKTDGQIYVNSPQIWVHEELMLGTHKSIGNDDEVEKSL